MKDEQIVDRRALIADRLREGGRRLHGEARQIQRRIERDVADRDRARRRVANDLADFEVLEEIADIDLRLAHVLTVCWRQLRQRVEIKRGRARNENCFDAAGRAGADRNRAFRGS